MNDSKSAYPIDLVIPWVDGADPLWQAQKAEYSGLKGDDRVIRYRDWDILKYIFRGVEKFLPWVRTVHFVTWGHLPPWLDSQCPKLHIVNHKDYIPQEYLPVFSSHPIELNLHKIEGLAEHFIYANDDTFFLKPMQPKDYFQNGLPVDSAVQNVTQFHRTDGIDHVVVNDLTYLNRNFSKRSCMRANKSKWFTPKYKSGALQNLYLLPFSHFTGFVDYHIPYPYLKSTFAEVWEKEPGILDTTCKNRVRSQQDVNQWLMRYWQFAKGSFVPCAPNKGRLFAIGADDRLIEDAILNQRYATICLSDDDVNADFEKEKAFLIGLFEQILPEKSSFEC